MRRRLAVCLVVCGLGGPLVSADHEQPAPSQRFTTAVARVNLAHATGVAQGLR